MTTPPANDPAHDHAAPAADLPETRAEAPAAPAASPAQPPQRRQKVRSTTAGGTWTALIIGAILLIVLLAFIMQNGESVTLHLFAWDLNFPLGVGMLLAAILGALIMACVGGIRMLQLRRQIKRG
ncbi:LapA family protein [Corynebacterium sphenisci]|uniref:LapA family protein n=1 Tax=Corynebacterium sphenisci TaxID=191493 RepID=UPI0026DF73B2|nr:lipopolysaccharide assembly protein LapA domain-containing protein [Corynebacterium sphenisci]MDO5731349.1 lipopolysaccharide assembly protein LapA domain-containing protein [Corynebacterium sphenisci]